MTCIKAGCGGHGDENFRSRGTVKGPKGVTLFKKKCIKCGTLNLIDKDGNHVVIEPVEAVTGAKGGVNVEIRDRMAEEEKAKAEADAKAKKLEEDKAAAEVERQAKRDEAKAESERVAAAELAELEAENGEEEEQPTTPDAD